MSQSISGSAGQQIARAMRFLPFVPPRWLRNAHVQTVYASRRPRRWNFGWEKWEPVEISLGKDGKLRAEASWQPGPAKDSPLLFLMHGLEGSAQSHYLLGISKKAYAAGVHTLRVNIRNCGGTENLTPTLYCAGLSQDVLSIVEHCRKNLGIEAIYAAGVSLGANIILKFLGEQGLQGPEYIRGAAVVSTPIDLELGVQKMERTQNWFYQKYFVDKLIERMRRKTALFPGLADMKRIEKIRSIREFDDVVTAPHFGFGTAENYYRLASARPLLRNICVPTLLIQAEDDPFIPFEPYLDSGIGENPFLRLLATKYGGHTGFLASRPSGTDQDAYWAESRVVQFLTALTFEG
ncbi:MAG TPA: alpha/beta fold hydrolase [Acidobacteriota bacterium]|nr:alpha/beta fold hydrolase [Acidobacteriota bacterium]